MDTIVVAVIALLAVGYLFQRFRVAARGKVPSCDCNTCGYGCGGAKVNCGADPQVILQEYTKIPDESGSG